MITDAQIRYLKKIVDNEFDVDILSKRRTMNLVNARLVYSYILRSRGTRLVRIAESIDKNHATILHAVKEFPFMRKWDVELERDYQAILILWEGESGEYEDIKPLQLKKELKLLHEQNKMLNLSLNNVQEQLKELENIVKNGK